MGKIIHARLDDETSEMLRDLVAKLESSESHVIREALKHFAATVPTGGKKKIIGLARFKSGVSDLGSNKRHLSGFGK